jgi:hypothetical protein
MDTREEVNLVIDLVRDHLEENGSQAGLDYITAEETEHIINIGASILCTKWGIGYVGGGFAQAVVANDLAQSFGRADGTSTKALKFFCQLMYNVGQPSFNTD